MNFRKIFLRIVYSNEQDISHLHVIRNNIKIIKNNNLNKKIITNNIDYIIIYKRTEPIA